MPVYAIGLVSIHDRGAYARYEEQFGEIFGQFDGEILGVEDAPRVIEGEWPHTRTVLLRFPSDESFHRWYQSEAYQAIAQHRFGCSFSQIALISGR